MLATPFLLGMILLGQSTEDSLTVGEAKVTLPAALLADGASADDERAALRKIAGTDRESAEFTRDSVTAPVIVKTHDVKAGDRGIIRQADLWFVVHANLDDIDPEKYAGPTDENSTFEAANMRFTAHEQEKPREKDGERHSSYRVDGRLLDRIGVEATNRVVAHKGKDSWTIAVSTDPKSTEDRWFPIKRVGGKDEPGQAEPYPGGIGHVKIARLQTVAGALLVEAHFAFFEPKAWFDGAPVLRSKIGVVAQDRVRALRRELAKARKTGSR